MVKIIPYIGVSNAKNAIAVYEDVFGAKLLDRRPMSPEIGAQMGFPEDFDYENSTMHAVIDIGGGQINIADSRSPPPSGTQVVMILLDLDSKDQIDAIWAKATEHDFKVLMDLQQTFWGAWYGQFEDGDGVQWQINFQEIPLEQAAPASKPAAKKAAKKAKKAKKAARKD